MSTIVPPATDAQVENALLEALAPPCEYAEHDAHGSGSAEWIVWPVTPLPCGCNGRIVLLCLPCLDFLRSTLEVRCAKCRDIYVFMDAVARMERI